jgi:hypothetical protein
MSGAVKCLPTEEEILFINIRKQAFLTVMKSFDIDWTAASVAFSEIICDM